jgi:hypothetical protein
LVQFSGAEEHVPYNSKSNDEQALPYKVPMSEMGLGCVKTPVAEAADDSRFRRSGRVGSSCGVWRLFCLERLLMRIPAVLRGSATGYSTCLRRLCPHRRQQRLDAHDVHDAREIVGQYVQGHLSSNPGATSSSGSSHPSPPVADISAYNAFKGSKASMRRAMGTTDTRRSAPRAPLRREPAGFAMPFRSHPTLKFSAEVFPLLGTSS